MKYILIKNLINPKRSASSAGFTMIELSLMLILMMVLTIGLVNTLDTSQASVQTAMLKVANDIRYAQDRAMVTGKVHGFQVLSNSTYQIYETAPGNLTLDPMTLSPMSINLNQNYGSTQFQETDYQIEFNSLGAPTLGSGLSVTLTNGSATRTFSINNNTGTINLP